ncbi:unnamed protein product [Lactuca saligna]|uniref:Uncharacterized protein n=1 Tax=Lactuca saligna TaxID=75948 RepID=A0AA35Z545_LACSI|nr:unnamed protein product [Lactuca saligna]
MPSKAQASTISITFSNRRNQPITPLFPSQSTKGDNLVPEDEQDDDDDVMVSFVEIHFDPEEDNIPDHLLISRKQLKILNHNQNSLLQIQADIGGQNTLSGIEMDMMLKSQEHHLKMAMDQIEQKHEECLKLLVENF